MRKPWSEKEEELFETAWKSTAYDRDDLERIFQRTFNSMHNKANRMGLPPRAQIERLARLESIERALKEDHIID